MKISWLHFSSISARRKKRRASALVITLAILALVTVLAVGLLGVMSIERASAHNSFAAMQVREFSKMAVDNALAYIQDATSAAENTSTNASAATHKFWASQPGMITVFNMDGSIDANSSRYLFSTNNSTTNMVDLNQATFSGTHPMTTNGTSGSPPVFSVSWINVLQDPLSAPSSTNPLIGRYAFWVDDESTKVNINTSDGSVKGTSTSFGEGTPTEVSLQALKLGGSDISAALAMAIAQQSGAQTSTNTPRGFNNLSELSQTAGVTTNLFNENKFDLTTYSRAPELNLFGEPKIYLVPTTSSSPPQNAMMGPYAYSGSGTPPSTISGTNLTQIYPISSTTANQNQLPQFTYVANGYSGYTITNAPSTNIVGLPQVFQDQSAVSSQIFSNTSPNYALGMRIARYLKGFNSQGNPINWPQFPGSNPAGFAGKYTDRQIDSIALQIVDLVQGMYPDHYRAFTLPSVMPGFLSGKLVKGVSLGPRVDEIVMDITTLTGSHSSMQVAVYVEWYLPSGFVDANINSTDEAQWAYGFGNYEDFLNFQDSLPRILNDSLHSTGGPSPLGGYWMNNILNFVDQNGATAGVDLWGRDPSQPDYDQANAQLYHPWLAFPSTSPYYGQIAGSGALAGRDEPMLDMGTPVGSLGAWTAGQYRVSINRYPKSAFYMKDGVTSLSLQGGFAIGLHSSSGSALNGYGVDPVPIDSLRGPATGESLSNPTVRSAVIAAVIPVSNTTGSGVQSITIPVPGHVTIHLQPKDPLVNSFPGDWVVTKVSSSSASEVTMGASLPTASTIPMAYMNGMNTWSQPANGGDPASAWWPPQSVYIPKSQRFPSAGYLQYIHTGLMPDPANDPNDPRYVAGNIPSGTPYRLINFSPSSSASQQTVGGASYPDWAMLDLFTVPAGLQPLGSPLPAPLQLTWGGATAGRINPNSAIIPFLSSVARTAPLEAQLKNLQVTTNYDSSGNPVASSIDEVSIAAAINTYVAGLGRPLMLPGEICNVPAVSNFVYSPVGPASASRNDLVFQIIGNLTTRSNTFTVWTVAQVIKKNPGNTNYGDFQPGDQILGEIRMQYLVERYIDLGIDGVPGDYAFPGSDGVVGTPDDLIDPNYHPSMTYPLPYKYRVVSASQIPE